MRTDKFTAEGTTCESCSDIIKRQARKVEGVTDVSFEYATEQGSVTYDPEKTDIDTILYKIEEKGYECFIADDSKRSNKAFGWVFGIIGLLIIGYFLFGFVDGFEFPEITLGMSYGLLFIVGLLTGFHCISMCGGFVVSYTAKAAQQGKKSHSSHLMYGAGKVVSYTVIGAAFGLIGSIIAFTPMMRGVVGVLAGLFLVLFGLKMLNVVPWLRRIQFRTPKFINKFVFRGRQKTSSPMVIGLLNGLMIACGPLQAIYILAAGTGSMLEGAKLLFIFGIGTLPVMIGFGYAASYLSGKFTHRLLKASSFIVIALGLIMINNGLTLTGSGFDIQTVAAAGVTQLTGSTAAVDENFVLKDGFQEIRMDVTRYGWEPNKFVLKKDVPVRWIINGKEINGCNNAIQVPQMNLNFPVKKGEQVIEFTPTEEGTIPWSCWMGMIPGRFVVVDDIDLDNQDAIAAKLDDIEVPKGGSCGGGSGGCGCGGARL